MKQRSKSDGSGYKSSVAFYNAIQKYGFENFTVEILYDNLTYEEACELEKQTIQEKKLQDPKFGYNILSGGDGIDPKIRSEIMKERYKDPTAREKLSKALKEYNKTEKAKEHHKRSSERITILRGNPVVSFDLTTKEPIKYFRSYGEASVAMSGNRHAGCISRVVDGKRESYMGLGWRKPTEEDLKFFKIS